MILSLIGMSGSGKTYWSRNLAEFGFERISCDDRIEEILRMELARAGHSGIQGVARWMGQPYEAGYAERQAAYLSSEIQVLREILEKLRQGSPGQLAIDTTGSVIYTGDALCRDLQAASTIVYLENSTSELESLFEQYSRDPKPVLWGELFRRQEGETNEAALARCYKDLLRYRRALYEKFATVRIPVAQLRREQPDAAGFLELIRKELARRP